jgi:mannose-6-phosphate isomerase-like protein (cupin superfamily)
MQTEYFAGETDVRPWGHWEVIGIGPRHVVKRISVTPGKRLSLQRHQHRAEHWVVVSGRGLMTLGERSVPVAADQHGYIPVREIHRIENTGTEDLVFIEVQTGELLSEADIERIQDDAGRV